MDPSYDIPSENLSQQISFQFIRPDEFKSLGIDPRDIPLGTIAAHKHPCQLQSRFGGNAYGFGLFEVYDQLRQKDIRLLQTINFEKPKIIKNHYKELNDIYKRIGLLIRFSSFGRPYYLIPVHFLSNTSVNIKAKIDEISKIIGFETEKKLKEFRHIGILCHEDDIILHELSSRFKEHRFVVLDSLDRIKNLDLQLDQLILARDPYEIIFTEDFSPLAKERLSKKRLDQYGIYILWKLYNLLKPEGEFFIISRYFSPKTYLSTRIIFKSKMEEKRFLLFTHFFKTRVKYKIKEHKVKVNVFDLHKYLGNNYVEKEIEDMLLDGKFLEDISNEEINNLPYLNFNFSDWPFLSNQERTWERLFSIFFEKKYFRPIIPQSIKDEWEKKVSFEAYTPNFMISYLGKKRDLKINSQEVIRDAEESGLIGFSTRFLAEYRDSFDYLIRTLRVLLKLRRGNYQGLPHNFIDRLKQPLENKNRRFSNLNNIISLTTKIRKLEKIRDYLNPDRVEGSRTNILKNMDALALFGFSSQELKEIFYIVVGHTTLGRIIAGKMNEKSLKPLSDLARTLDLQDALNLLRYCRLMTMAEMESSKRSELSLEELGQLFDTYESIVRIVTDQTLDWDTLLDEKTASMGGVHFKIVQKLLRMMNRFEFLDNWHTLKGKGQMEKESLADYDESRLARIEDVIKLEKIIDKFEEMYLKSDPLQLPVFYRKFLDIEFHGTGRLFERMSGADVFVLLWITVNVAQGEVINFNPILGNVASSEIDKLVIKVADEARQININYLDLNILKRFSEQLYQNGFSFVVGTGFLLKIEKESRAIEISYMDMDKNIRELEIFSRDISGLPLSRISIGNLKKIETLFSNLENFYQSHIRLLDDKRYSLKFPSRQKEWFTKVQTLREYLRKNFFEVTFSPNFVYTDLDLLYSYAPSILNFILPEFTELEDLDLSSNLYLKSPVTQYIINATKKFQALIRHDKESFQDTHFLHNLALREFGPLATGIVGASEHQIEDLERIVDHLKQNKSLITALVLSFIFQDIGRVPMLREKYKERINPAYLSHAGAFIIGEEKIAERYHFDEKGKSYLVFLIKHHGLLHHIFRGELSFFAIQDVVDAQDKDLFDAFFIFCFLLLSSIRQDLLLEDLASRLFQIRNLCHKVIDGSTTPEEYMNAIFAQRGRLFYALEAFHSQGLPEGISPSEYLKSSVAENVDKTRSINAGRMIFSLERIFRLKGIRYVEFSDLVNLMLKVPLRYIYKKKVLSSTGYDTFEKEVCDALRIYKTFQSLAEEIRHYILEKLVGDRVRIFGYEKICGYLNPINQVKLLLISLLGSEKLNSHEDLVCLNFLSMSEKIEKRYEAVNKHLDTVSIEMLWDNENLITQFFESDSGLFLRKDAFPTVLTIDFQDSINIDKIISFLNTITESNKLKDYFNNCLKELKAYQFYTGDYELQLETAYRIRMTEIAELMLNHTKEQMDKINSFVELHNLFVDLIRRSDEIGLSEDQKHRLNDLYELRKDGLKRNMLTEVNKALETVNDIKGLKLYWDKKKWDLQCNRRFFGKEFENLIAERFDETNKKLTA
ncbi:MAG TPA: hypothetical protein PK874_00190 [Desulfobacteraceae bacterium]|nr:hypothetical protein [Desulfobacteraceae bacterium]